jgi:hypothetical protein
MLGHLLAGHNYQATQVMFQMFNPGNGDEKGVLKVLYEIR